MTAKKQKQKIEEVGTVLVKIKVNYLIGNIRYDRGETVAVSPSVAETLKGIGVAE